jgi:hypothetical protein
MDPIDEIHGDMQRYRETVSLGAQYDILVKSPEFQKLVLEGYLKQQAVYLTHALGTPGANQAAIFEQLNAIGHFANYLETIKQQATAAQESLLDSGRMLERLYEERL